MVISLIVKVASGVTRTVSTPKNIVRLQIIKGCDVANIAYRMSDYLNNYKDTDLEIIVVDTNTAYIRNVSQSFVISREKDNALAVLFAEMVGLETQNIIYKPLENNYKQISTTLVLGNDYKVIKLPKSINKE